LTTDEIFDRQRFATLAMFRRWVERGGLRLGRWKVRDIFGSKEGQGMLVKLEGAGQLG
jgi:hypothetical protein